MSIIKKLPEVVANKISAGEVVTRPASVVKELVENAIDAGADEITIIVKESGKTLIQVIDNGCAMSEEDALVSFERFTTSKITEAEDLENLHTLGFRGEALASIASVSQVELKTKRREDSTAILIRINGGTIEEVSKAQSADGTSFSVRNLFYNVPARRKFLKSNSTEFKHIYEVVQAQSLFHADISWTLISDDDEVFKLKSDSIPSRLNYFFGKDFSNSLIEFSETNDFMKLRGWLGKPSMMKRTKNEQFLFINGRITQSRMINHSVAQGYGQLLGEREYPFSLIYLEIAPNRVDVNVHPTKMEVRFEDERNIYNMINAVVRRAVNGIDFSPNVKLEEKPDFVSPRESEKSEYYFPSTSKRMSYNDRDGEVRTSNALFSDYKETSETMSLQHASERHAEVTREPLFPEPNFEAVQPSAKPNSTSFQVIYKSGESGDRKTDERVLWQVHNKYILTPIKSGIMLIDQHVAHERILYERALAVMEANIPNSQQLLFTHKVELKQWEYEILEAIRDDISRLGFSLTFYSGRTVLIEGIPPDVRPGSEEKILHELLEQYQDYREKLQLDVRDNLAKSYACRSSIMAGDKLSHSEMSVLIDQLFATSMPYVCPHGRPIIIKLSIEELDKMFGR